MRKNICSWFGQKCSVTECPCNNCHRGMCSKKCHTFICKFDTADSVKINTGRQEYKGIILKCIDRTDYPIKKAKRFTINGTNQNIWIPNKHLKADGTIKDGENIDYIINSLEFKHKLSLTNKEKSSSKNRRVLK